MQEEWRDVVGYEGFYLVSSFGNIKSLTRYVNSRNGVRPEKGKDITKIISNKGYYRVQLNNGKCRKWFYVHRLVAEAFITNPDNLPCVNHKDEIPLNNSVDNLEWCSYKYNSNYGTSRERISRSNKGRKRSKEFCEHMRKVRTGTKLSECTKRKIGEASKQLWKQEAYRQNVLIGKLKHR